MPKMFSDPDAIAEDIIRDVGTNLVVGLPLGLGKANHIVNALYRRAAADRSIRLTLFSALTLEKPRPSSLLERRFIAPVIDRLFGGYPDLDYAKRAACRRAAAQRRGDRVLLPRRNDGCIVPFAQQHYISANYTHAASYLLARGLNVITQLVAKRVEGGVDALQPELQHRHHARPAARARGGPRRVQAGRAGQLANCRSCRAPAILRPIEFSAVLDSPATDFPLFAPPSEPVTDTKYAIGLHAAGPGARRRHAADRHRPGRRRAGAGPDRAPPRQCAIPGRHAAAGTGAPPLPAAQTAPFEAGLYGVSEMLFEAFLGLIDAGILKREVDGVVLHGAFFLGPKSFYRALREMTPEQLARIQMMPVSFTNELYGDEAGKRRARVDARFVNNAMMATLLGAVVSDGLEDGQVVSGVGGQYNFVAQAFALQGARSILTLESTRSSRRQGALQHPLELWPRDHSASSARHRRHRIRRRRSARQIRCRCHRGDAGGHRFAVSGRTDAAGQGRRQACAQLSKFPPPIATTRRSASPAP